MTTGSRMTLPVQDTAATVASARSNYSPTTGAEAVVVRMRHFTPANGCSPSHSRRHDPGRAPAAGTSPHATPSTRAASDTATASVTLYAKEAAAPAKYSKRTSTSTRPSAAMLGTSRPPGTRDTDTSTA